MSQAGLAKLPKHGAQRQTEIGTRITIGNRKYVYAIQEILIGDYLMNT